MSLYSGSINQAGSTIRLNAQLIDSKTGDVLKSFQIDGKAGEYIFPLIDSLSVIVKNFLIISKLKKDIACWLLRMMYQPGSPEAFRYFIYGRNVFYDR